MSTNSRRWWQLQSPEMREVYAHLTDAERAKLQGQGGLYGMWVFATFAAPLSYVLVYHRNPLLMVLAGILITIHIALIPSWRRHLKRTMCASIWAQEHGFTPERI